MKGVLFEPANLLRAAVKLCCRHLDAVPERGEMQAALRSPELAGLAARVVDDGGRWPVVKANCEAAWTMFVLPRYALARKIWDQYGLNEAVLIPHTTPPRILRTRLGRCTMDGLIPVETHAYFSAHPKHDGEELPPWDTWIGIGVTDGGVHIDSWVPPWALAYAQAAIDCDPVDMYEWVRWPVPAA